jgi:hypothetical protein
MQRWSGRGWSIREAGNAAFIPPGKRKEGNNEPPIRRAFIGGKAEIKLASIAIGRIEIDSAEFALRGYERYSASLPYGLTPMRNRNKYGILSS